MQCESHFYEANTVVSIVRYDASLLDKGTFFNLHYVPNYYPNMIKQKKFSIVLLLLSV